jgi:FAD/FMN-containing dehydrogenase
MANLSFESLSANFAGDLLTRDAAGYEQARRIWNASIDKRPGLIARCTGTADVVAAVNYARENDLLTAIRGGGHNVGGRALCDNGIVIDLSRMRAISVEPGDRVFAFKAELRSANSTVRRTHSVSRCLVASFQKPELPD